MMMIIGKSATLHNSGQCTKKKEAVAIVKLQVLKFGGLCKQEKSLRAYCCMQCSFSSSQVSVETMDLCSSPDSKGQTALQNSSADRQIPSTLKFQSELSQKGSRQIRLSGLVTGNISNLFDYEHFVFILSFVFIRLIYSLLMPEFSKVL